MRYRPGTILAHASYSAYRPLKLYIFLSEEDGSLVCMNFLRVSHELSRFPMFERNFSFYSDDDLVRERFSKPMEEIMQMRHINKFAPSDLVPFSDVQHELHHFLSRIYRTREFTDILDRQALLQNCLSPSTFSPLPQSTIL